jgi:hypothetical protein
MGEGKLIVYHGDDHWPQINLEDEASEAEGEAHSPLIDVPCSAKGHKPTKKELGKYGCN